MRDAVASVTFLGAVLLVCVLKIDMARSDDTPLASSDDNPQMASLAKRDWNKDLHIWGKRAWNNLHDGWGKRSIPDEEKRAWSNLHSGWGKRSTPDEEKRAWSNLHSGWGKRHAITAEDEEGLRKLLALLQNYPVSTPQINQDNFGNDLNPYPNANANDNPSSKCWECMGPMWGRSVSANDFYNTNNENEVPEIKNFGGFQGSWGKRNSKWDNFRGTRSPRSPGGSHHH